MLKQTKKIFIVLLSVFCIFSIYNTAFAEDNPNFSLETIESSTQVPDEVTNLTKGTIGSAISVIRIVASGALVIIIVVIAIKYMTSSAGDRADIKKHAVAYVIAALIIFGSSVIIEVLVELAGEIKAE